MAFDVKANNFCINDQKVFLNSGEIHYFRIRRELWDKHLVAAKEAGLMAVSTYIPWAWHEQEEGVFDLTGETHPECDLNRWLQCCQDHGLYCIVKPGPFILAETRGAGLPHWFLEQYGDEVKIRNRKGEIVQSEGVNLFHPRFLEKVTLWYNRIMPFISEREASSGGPVIMMQICNEIGVFAWLAHQADYGQGVKERFVSYLKEKFGKIEEVNRLWGKNYRTFSEVELPPDGNLPFLSKEDRSRDYEWHCFWRIYYGDYLKMLGRMARDRGVTVPFFHNLPGWIFGNGFEFPVNITMYEELFGERSEFLFGVDHIPEFLSYRNMHDDRIINDITKAMQGDRPLFAAEFQCGSREYHVVTNSRELELFYKASIAHGLTGWNYYMFSQGRNPRHRGYSGDTFYWFTPVSAEGDRSRLFPLVHRMSKIIKVSEDLILGSHRKAKVCVLFYPPYYATELERPEDGASGLRFNFASIRRPAYFDGLLKALQVLNVDYDMANLSQSSTDTLKAYQQVWAFSTDEMNAREQQILIDYARGGGNLVVFPYLPDRELNQQPCSIIRDSLSIAPSGKDAFDSPLIDIYGLLDIKCANPQIIYSEDDLKGTEIVARTIKGNACGFIKSLGLGSIIHLGTWIGFDTEGHKAVYEAILNISGAQLRQASADCENIVVRERFKTDGSAILFIGNYYNEEQTGKVTYTHPQSGEAIAIPYSGQNITWPALYGLLTPVYFEITSGLKMLHCTSDILEIKKAGSQVEITLFGDRDMIGEIVFEGVNTRKIYSATLDDESIKIKHIRDRIILTYRHKDKEEIVLNIQWEQ
jgi:beta-galactosidase